jgi:hypothetical protein
LLDRKPKERRPIEDEKAMVGKASSTTSPRQVLPPQDQHKLLDPIGRPEQDPFTRPLTPSFLGHPFGLEEAKEGKMGKSRRGMKRQKSGVPGVAAAEGARRATVAAATEDAAGGSLNPGQRWIVSRKREVVLRMFRGESLDKLSREFGVEIYRLEKWRDRALAGMDASLKKRKGDLVQAELDAAMKRLGQLTMENELLVERCRKSNIPFPKGRSRK